MAAINTWPALALVYTATVSFWLFNGVSTQFMVYPGGNRFVGVPQTYPGGPYYPGGMGGRYVTGMIYPGGVYPGGYPNVPYHPGMVYPGGGSVYPVGPGGPSGGDTGTVRGGDTGSVSQRKGDPTNGGRPSVDPRIPSGKGGLTLGDLDKDSEGASNVGEHEDPSTGTKPDSKADAKKPADPNRGGASTIKDPPIRTAKLTAADLEKDSEGASNVGEHEDPSTGTKPGSAGDSKKPADPKNGGGNKVTPSVPARLTQADLEKDSEGASNVGEHEDTPTGTKPGSNVGAKKPIDQKSGNKAPASKPTALTAADLDKDADGASNGEEHHDASHK